MKSFLIMIVLFVQVFSKYGGGLQVCAGDLEQLGNVLVVALIICI